MATGKSASRRTPVKHPAGGCNAVSTPDVKFPVELPKPRQTAPDECVVLIVETSEDAVRVRVIPREPSVRQILDDTYGPGGWCKRQYFADGQLWCAVGVYCPATGEYVYKDAAAIPLPCRDPALMRTTTSFLAAASIWGAGRDVMELGNLLLKSTQVPIVQGERERYRLNTSLRVDRFARDEAGRITMVQFELADGKKALWEKT
mgnify:FL=1